jgi:hypothetical protein
MAGTGASGGAGSGLLHDLDLQADRRGREQQEFTQALHLRRVLLQLARTLDAIGAWRRETSGAGLQ